MLRLLLTLTVALLLALPAFAHGTDITYTVDEATDEIALVALFDDGEPMAEAQVVVYSPADLQTPYLRGLADDNGLYNFSLDTGVSGTWEVTVRVASHGEVVYIPVSNSGEIGRMATRTALPRPLLAGAVIAALGGVAFYYSRKN